MMHNPTPEIERPIIAPYDVKDSGETLESIVQMVNYSQFGTYSADYCTGVGLKKVVASPLFHYKQLLQQLSAIEGSTFLTMEERLCGQSLPDKRMFVIRHDVDGDIVAALEMARLEESLGIETTYYILHTAYYYGRFEEARFLRHDAMAEVYRQIQDLGHEVSLHTDPLLIYQDHLMDGADAVVKEIAWLRSKGIRVPGSAAHNHHMVYGAQNFEMFKGRFRNYVLPGGNRIEVIDADEVHFKGKWAPLHRLSEKQLGLCYEGHDAYSLPGYLGIASEIGYNSINQTWNCQTDHKERGLKNGPGDRYAFYRAAGSMRRGETLILSTHPLYYGARPASDVVPPIEVKAWRTVVHPRLGWRAFEPGALVADTDANGEEQTYQTIHFANEFGMLSRPLPAEIKDHFLILAFGGDKFQARAVGLPNHMESLVEARVGRLNKRETLVRTFAGDGMAIDRYYAWIDKLAPSMLPDIVVLELDWQLALETRRDQPPAKGLLDGDEGGDQVLYFGAQGAVFAAAAQAGRNSVVTDSVSGGLAPTAEDRIVGLYAYACEKLRHFGVVPVILQTALPEGSGGAMQAFADPAWSFDGTCFLDAVGKIRELEARATSWDAGRAQEERHGLLAECLVSGLVEEGLLDRKNDLALTQGRTNIALEPAASPAPPVTSQTQGKYVQLGNLLRRLRALSGRWRR